MQSKISNVEILLIAVGNCGGKTQAIHTEDIAIEAFEIAPNRFGWRKYPERIDLELVRRALTSAVQKKPPLLEGSVRRGWMLTKSGVQWLEQNSSNISGLQGNRRGSLANALDMERTRLRETNAWRKYQSGITDWTVNDLYEFARINEYFSNTKRRERITLISNAVEDEPDLINLWNQLQTQFPEKVG
ncbi:MAG: hypothetical protein B6D41_00810 [Chloroflexi bacterium UTCFX4]|jgi:hypothetical protein|nr:MAG: hypothetical protein B6D41_00810 [Chloroflexi bacterium UTCFX4]